MLVLSRKKFESLMIGDDIEITIVGIKGDKIRIGVTAPPNVTVHRREIWEKIRCSQNDDTE